MRHAIATISIAMLAMCFMDLATAQEEKPQSEEAGKPLTRTTGSLRVMGASAIGLTTPERVWAAVESNYNLTKTAVGEVSPDAAKSGRKVCQISWREGELRIPPEVATLVVVVESYDERVPAEKVLERLPNVLTNCFMKLDAAYQSDLVRREKLGLQYENVRGDLESGKGEYQQLVRAENAPLNAEVAAQQRSRLDAQIETISAELEGLAARREVLEKLIAEVGKRGAEEADNDPVIAELQQAVALRAELVRRLREAKAASSAILTKESELAEHKAELAKMRRDVTQAAGGQRLGELVRRLEDASVEQAEATARSKALVKMRDSIGYSTNLEMRRLELERLEASYREVTQVLDKLERRIRLYQPPQVTLLKAD